jgi:hypothetical protein
MVSGAIRHPTPPAAAPPSGGFLTVCHNPVRWQNDRWKRLHYPNSLGVGAVCGVAMGVGEVPHAPSTAEGYVDARLPCSLTFPETGA